MGERIITISEIKRAVAEAFGVDIALVDGSLRKRTRHAADARMSAMFFTRRITGLSYPKIGKEFLRTSPTAIYAHRVVGERIYLDWVFGECVKKSAKKLGVEL